MREMPTLAARLAILDYLPQLCGLVDDLEQRRIVRLLIDALESRRLRPLYGLHHILNRQVLPNCCPTAAIRMPQPTLLLRYLGQLLSGHEPAVGCVARDWREWIIEIGREHEPWRDAPLGEMTIDRRPNFSGDRDQRFLPGLVVLGPPANHTVLALIEQKVIGREMKNCADSPPGCGDDGQQRSQVRMNLRSLREDRFEAIIS